jgi:hypothetical protein
VAPGGVEPPHADSKSAAFRPGPGALGTPRADAWRGGPVRGRPGTSFGAAQSSARTLAAAAPVTGLAADGSVAAVATDCGNRFLDDLAWNPVLRSVVSMGSPRERECWGASTGEGKEGRRRGRGAADAFGPSPELAGRRHNSAGYRTLRVIRVRDNDADQPPVLVVEDMAE